MTKNTVPFGGDDTAALDYIRQRGYASYSSIVRVREKKDPEPYKTTAYYEFGKELHSRYLENTKLQTLSPPEEKVLESCIASLLKNAVASKILQGAECEVEIRKPVYGLPVLSRLDILNKTLVGDLKTTRHTKFANFAASLDFLQAALYMEIAKRNDFYYIGISKVAPFKVFIFSVNQYPQRIKRAQVELYKLIKYIKSKL